jgi:phosphatidylethanolamine/phosphatidyl-N-methylethanolamine N-methyltransferase
VAECPISSPRSYAPYLVNALPNPAGVAREMLRVCRPGGRIVFLNHFRLRHGDQLWDRWVGRLASSISGVNWKVDLDVFLRDAGLSAASVEAVNVPPVSSVVLCFKS